MIMGSNQTWIQTTKVNPGELPGIVAEDITVFGQKPRVYVFLKDKFVERQGYPNLGNNFDGLVLVPLSTITPNYLRLIANLLEEEKFDAAEFLFNDCELGVAGYRVG